MDVTPHSRYNVPLIPQNLRREETVVQIADALSYLQEIANDIFNRVNCRIKENAIQLGKINDRISVTNAQISKLKGAKNATQVFSSSKYPAADIHRQYKSIFDDDRPLSFKKSKIQYKQLQVRQDPLETLQFYYVKVRDTDNFSSTHGLGKLPKDVNSITDLLLYNTGKNPYKKYVLSDPLQASAKVKKEEADVSSIGAAPYSISEKKTVPRSTADAYFYSPDLGDVPSLDVPLDLPDLPGIADDLRFVKELEPGIAPSVTTTPSVPELPPLEEPTKVVGDKKNAEDVPSFPPRAPTPPPPPPPSFQTSTPKEESKQHVTTPALTDDSTIHLESNLDEPDSTIVLDDSSSSKSSFNISDAHASLMEAIRRAGGSKTLKATEPKNSNPPPSGDLMADLHAKLSLRRKGISGSKYQEEGFDSTSAMTKISAMIPPPVKNQNDTDSKDDDWDE